MVQAVWQLMRLLLWLLLEVFVVLLSPLLLLEAVRLAKFCDAVRGAWATAFFGACVYIPAVCTV